MNRLIAVATGISLTAMALSQGAFTIRRPVDGSVVREVVTIRIPKGSIPESGYVGIVVNGKFLEAVAPLGRDSFDGNDFVYRLDTKAREIPDGKLDIEAVLYGDFGDSARVLNRSSVELRLDNRSSIKPPAGGFKLRYRFNPGTEHVYSVEMRQAISQTTEAQARLGGRAAELPLDAMKFRYLVSVDNAYAMGAGRTEGLIRLQPMPKPGKDYAILSTLQDPTPRRYYDYEMHPIYMRIKDTGREVFGRAPIFVSMEGTSGFQTTTDLFTIIPLPVLPEAGVTQGQTWNAAMVSFGLADPNELYSAEKVTKPIPARGTLEAIEWERGTRCARIRNKIAVSAGKGADQAAEEAEEVFWFSLDKGTVIKIERNFTRTVRIRTDQMGMGGMAGAPSGGRGGIGVGTAGGGRGGGGQASAGLATGPEIPQGFNQVGGYGDDERRGRSGGQMGGRRGGGMAPGGFGPGAAGMGGPGSTGGRIGGSTSTTRILKERTQIIMTLQ